MSVGAGPLDGRLSKLFVRLSLTLSDFRSYRDAGSQRLIRALGYLGADQVVSDLAYDRKTRELMEDMGQGDYVVTLESLSARDLQARLRIGRAGIEQDVIRRRAAQYKAAFEAQYQAVFQGARGS